MVELSTKAVEVELAKHRESLCGHPIYSAVRTLDDLRLFMESHVFAVWDFMSLLKWLQRSLTCVDVPWVPAANTEGARLVNEIVLGEESDEQDHGRFASHFEMYRDAMIGIGASTEAVDQFVGRVASGQPISTALEDSRAPHAAAEFVHGTFSVIATDDVRAVAAAFAYGREDILPDLFERVTSESHFVQTDPLLDAFRYYLERHIELDGDSHGPMAARLIEVLCGSDSESWDIVLETAAKALSARQLLWDGIHGVIAASKAA